MNGISRRQFLRISALASAGTLAAGCVVPQPVTQPAVQPEASPSAPPEVPEAPPARYSEAPMLADLVAAGELPPVEERLPENPDEVAPLESIGKYGGAWRRGFAGVYPALARSGFGWHDAVYAAVVALLAVLCAVL